MAISSELSSFQPESAPRLARVCAATGRPFAPGDKVYSVLIESDGRIVRRDFSASAWRSTPRPENALAWWSSRVREDSEKEKKAKIAPNDALTALFVALADKPGQEALRYALALLLARRRVLRFDYEENAATREDLRTANTIYVYSPREETGYFVPIVEMTPERVAEVQSRLVALLEEPSAALEEAQSSAPLAHDPSEEHAIDRIGREARLQAAFSAFDETEISAEAFAAAQAALGE